jgi:hypothetical protein
MTPEAWSAMFPPPAPPKQPEADDVKRRPIGTRQKTVMTITVIPGGVHLAASCCVEKFVAGLKSQTRSRTWDPRLGTWWVRFNERAIAEKLALDHFDEVILVEGEGRRRLKPYPWQIKHQAG